MVALARNNNEENKQQLITIVTGKLVASRMDFSELQQLFKEFTYNAYGQVIHFSEDLFIVTFEGPSRAVGYGLELRDELKARKVQLAVGIHIRECNSGSSINNQTIDIVRSLLDKVELNHVLISETVRQLLSDQGLTFSSYKNIFEPISNELLRLFKVDHGGAGHDGSKYDKLKHHHSSLISMVVDVINSNMNSESFRVDKICKEVGISERQLQRKLKLLTKKSPWQFITSVRLNWARDLLLSQKGSISEVAFKTGYSNPSYFAKCFKKEFGANPSDFVTHPARI